LVWAAPFERGQDRKDQKDLELWGMPREGEKLGVEGLNTKVGKRGGLFHSRPDRRLKWVPLGGIHEERKNDLETKKGGGWPRAWGRTASEATKGLNTSRFTIFSAKKPLLKWGENGLLGRFSLHWGGSLYS